MPHGDNVTLTYKEWRILQDRLAIAEDRLRIIRHAVKIHRKLPKWPGKWLTMLRAIRAALATGSDDGP